MSGGFVGAGVAYRRRYHEGLLAMAGQPQAPRVLEVMAGHMLGQDEALEALAAAYPLVLHEVCLSPGTCAPDGAASRGFLRELAAQCARAKPLMFSEHLSLSDSPEGISLGHLAPLWYTREALGVLEARVKRWQDALQVPVALETISAPFVIPCADYHDEAEFLGELVHRTGCGVLLDLTNLWFNGQNLGFDPVERLRAYPLEAVWAVHLAGGAREQDGWWVDTHAAPVSEASYGLLRALRGLATPNLRAVIIERDGAWPPLEALCGEAARAQQEWDEG